MSPLTIASQSRTYWEKIPWERTKRACKIALEGQKRLGIAHRAILAGKSLALMYIHLAHKCRYIETIWKEKTLNLKKK